MRERRCSGNVVTSVALELMSEVKEIFDVTISMDCVPVTRCVCRALRISSTVLATENLDKPTATATTKCDKFRLINNKHEEEMNSRREEEKNIR